jgi:hypothetical protein
MKKLFAAALLLATTAFAGDKVIQRGAAISKDVKTAALAEVMAKPDSYSKDAVLVEGVIVSSCSRAGCWMELAPAEGQDSVRVTFKDYGFFIPLEAKGMKARAEGVTEVKELSKSEVDHLVSEGARIIRREDGSAIEVSFVANGVELSKL